MVRWIVSCCLSVLMFALTLPVETLPVGVDEAARVTCALHWTGLNLTPLISEPLLQAAPSGSIAVENLLSKETLTVFYSELDRFRKLRALAEKDSLGADEQAFYDSIVYETRQCYSGQDGMSFTKSFDFSYNTTQTDTHELVEEGVVRILKEEDGSRRASGRKVLSIGCGDGRWVARYAAAALASEDRLVLLDLHASNLEAAKVAVGASVALKEVHTVAEDLNLVKLRAVNLGATGFDLVESSLMLHHVQNLEDLLSDIYNLLVPGGVFVVLDVIDLNVKEADMLHAEHSYVPPFHGVEFFRTHQELLALMSNAGFVLLNYTRVDPATVTFTARKPEFDRGAEL